MTPPAVDAPTLARAVRRERRRRTAGGLLLVAPLLVFLGLTLLLPIGTLLARAVHDPQVATALPATAQALDAWDRVAPLPDAARVALQRDLLAATDDARIGGVARRLNGDVPGARSLVMGTWRALHHDPAAAGFDPTAPRAAALEAFDARWADPAVWIAIARNAAAFNPDDLLAAVDLRRDAQGGIARVPADESAFGRILARTLGVSAAVTALCLLLGYPLAWWISTLPPQRAALAMIAVLLPFWTSVLVRAAAWVVLLQREGLVNQALIAAGVIAEPLALIFNRTGVVISMTHVLLPFMVLPLLAAMRAVPPTLMRAAVSLGSPPLQAFVRVWMPQTRAGVAAGVLLVFILALGYYVTPALLGGADDQMLSYYVARYANVEIDWGMACALAVVLLAATLVLYTLYRRVARDTVLGA
ncbi:MAG: ABC transporter permease [Burkholderiales bacterium]|nr:ABC transporter permease [Burkholderiales bacterium]